ncbi:sigma-54-dependent transcriptional regulator [Acidaminobacter sp.]|uniref:sigma-54-dependent transcriptional regulator n=1 Tax=Acidaminobacter sp. TaxID=1872102 RepID=UPI0013825457|nr:sigma-54 dependent transcriptional regulator [Acidaminobacter sp.]MDK9710623.1 sigma-54 dependent transcriptional regulator [Acidaminobacter sp.]MZQ96390.1 response regulator [Acidaminobacter sp.]
MIYRILVIDDEKSLSHSLCEGLGDLGYQTQSASNAAEAVKQMAAFKPHIALLDLRLGKDNGLELLPELKKIDSDLVAFMMTAYGDVKTAVAAIKAGAFDYLHKPFEFDELDILIQKGIDHLKAMNRLTLYEDEKLHRGKYMIGEHELLKAVMHRVEVVAPSERTTVLIQGETGTGKELVAEAIHRLSPRSALPFVKINCGAIPQNLMESELFGFEKNAFTGAAARKKGLLELADGGTVFLDEIGELPLELQSKLLRFLEDRKFKRVGGLEDLEVDVRVLAATNRDLKQAIEEKYFREDLYYRLHVFPIQLPPLRQRGEDILLLTRFFFENEAKKHQRPVPELTEEAKRCMLTYQWPGNVRELKNVVERTILLYPQQRLEPIHLPPEISKLRLVEGEEIQNKAANNYEVLLARLTSGVFSLEEEVGFMERQYIEVALALSNQQISKAADLLGISRFALKRKLEKG